MRRLAVASLLLLSAPLFTAVPWTAACPPETPEAVLDCLEQAYAERDIDLYASLLADDFVFEQTDMKAFWDRQQDLAATRGLFESHRVVSLAIVLELEESGSVREADEPGLFILDGVSSRIEITDKEKEGDPPKHYTVTNQGMQLWVRSDGEGQPFRIVRWMRSMEGD
jgi:hypothetical protein